jgi:hypothetical protein
MLRVVLLWAGVAEEEAATMEGVQVLRMVVVLE